MANESIAAAVRQAPMLRSVILLACSFAFWPGAANAADSCWSFVSHQLCLDDAGGAMFYDVVGEHFEAAATYSRNGNRVEFVAVDGVAEAWPWETSPVTCEWIDRGAQLELRQCTGASRLGAEEALLLTPFTPVP